jgi:hypothetical protein
MKRYADMTLIEKLQSVGTLTSMNQAIRFITNTGHIVLGWNSLTASVLDHDDIEFKETADGRIRLK